MGIYIEGVNLPELSDYSKRNNTPEVYNLHGAIVVYPDGKVELKSYIGTFEGTYNVISVSPHGRLIDADELRDSNHDVFEIDGAGGTILANYDIFEIAGADGTIFAMDVSIIDDAPTIIPADKEKT